MTLDCKQTIPMIPSYLDGELSEAQAGPLRKHLLDCHSCRSTTQDEKALKRWFVPEDVGCAGAIPAGFAAHVARRAFAGDTGEGYDLIPHQAPPGSSGSSGRSDETGPGNVLQFVLQVTAAAAIVLIMLSIGIRNRSLPESGGLMADDAHELSLSEILKGLEGLPAEPAPVLAPDAAAPDVAPDMKRAEPAGTDEVPSDDTPGEDG